MNFKLNIIVAVSENMGIGMNGDLPWRLRKEMAYFSRMTKRTKDSSKQNAVIMGRKTWESIPDKNRPLAGRINIVLSRQDLKLGLNTLACSSLETALQSLQEPPLAESIESAWVIGGSSVYKEAMASPHCSRIYLTKIFKTFECDTFLPEVPMNTFKLVKDPDVPEEMQEENGVLYGYQVYERLHDFNSLKL
ncbi:dihydrofolate reductase isoform X2 [Zootermopsis nevadensis]|uniref:dihydrofolate reductase n=1 Tax=Zootermopsis nevadensis TaxID=136037 RepID=A0A067R1L3_ZOONE|nr:dihydrofolate reductase isoform X2 [Zootermopsis nevadensis]KDR11482.1 Dihydrofolate reductase [Zootermopsis nevadensis]